MNERHRSLSIGELASSHLDIPGTTNLRDLGRYPAAGQAVIAPRQLYRSEVLTLSEGGRQGVFDPTHTAAYRALGVRAVIDLRSDHEVEAVPSAWPETTGACVFRFAFAEGGEGADTSFFHRILGGELERFDKEQLTRFYCDILDRSAETFAQVIETLADASRLPALVHCSAGKDRTGILIALVLELLGTPREFVVADYALTGVLRPDRVETYAPMLIEAGVDPKEVRVLFESPAISMAQTLRYLDEKHGGVVAYLISSGLHEKSIEDLRRGLLLG